jgi:hypothetical protein
MTWTDKTLTFRIAFGLDLFAAAVVFGQYGISVSSMAGLVRDGLDGPLKLKLWQHDFLRWLEPKLSRAHCAGAVQYDRDRAQLVLNLLKDRT